MEYLNTALSPVKSMYYIDNITITEANGDSMHIKFENTIINKPLPKKCWDIKWKLPKETEQAPSSPAKNPENNPEAPANSEGSGESGESDKT